MRGTLAAAALAALIGLGLFACGDEPPEDGRALQGEPGAAHAGAQEAPAAQAARDAEAIRATTGAVDGARIAAADDEPGNWLSHGRTYSEQRFSPLDQIHAENVGELGLAWWVETGTRRGLEATPIAVDGILYFTTSWSKVMAVDARSGTALWTYDPQVPPETGGKACCDVVNRGVAVWQGKVFSGTLDGRLIALDAATGELLWEKVTVDQRKPYTITGAPRVVKGRVIIGNGGAEYGVRGYVSAYDAETGALAWRFYTVPGNPADPPESPALARAMDTWKGGEWWKVGGGGTVWDSIVYDPELDLLYVGTGNGSPWSHFIRSPGGGDNLYLSSILALDPDTGALVWHYQTTPGDTWDYTSTQPMILADLEIEGRTRKVLMQAPKNGFFYVLDRTDGKLISAEPFAEVTWAKRVNVETGRPEGVEVIDYRDEAVEVKPSPHGAHNWHPMSYSPQTGLVYIPAQEIPYFFLIEKGFEYKPGAWNLGYDFNVGDDFPRDLVSGHLLAWDPVRQKEVWRAQYTGPWNGGTLATAGNLVFQGTAHGSFVAYRASDGKQLWEAPAGTGVIAGPISYLVDGEQYVSVLAGWGGAFALAAGDAAAAAGNERERNWGRLLTFKLGGKAKLPIQKLEEQVLAAIPAELDPGMVQHGTRVYHRWCSVCHGPGVVGGGVLPDLRKSAPGVYDALDSIVLEGAYLAKGMPRFDRWLEPSDVDALRHYLLSRRAQLLAEPAEKERVVPMPDVEVVVPEAPAG